MGWKQRIVGSVLAAVPLVAASAAHGWQFVEVRNAYGDAGTAIVQPARNQPDAVLAVGCDGDRFRVVSIAPAPGRTLGLDEEDGQVRISFSAEPGPKERWQVHRRAKGVVAYVAPAATPLVRSMIQQETKNPEVVLRADVTSKGKPLVLEFPLAGLKAAVRKDLWEPCKMGNYIPESEFDAQ